MNDVTIQLHRGVVVEEVGVNLHANTNPGFLPTMESASHADSHAEARANSHADITGEVVKCE